MVDVKAGPAWLCRPEGPRLEDILLPVQMGNDNEEELWQLHAEDSDRAGGVLLERVQDGAPCGLRLNCRPPRRHRPPAAAQPGPDHGGVPGGEYLGTVRGDPQTHRVDGGPLYRKQLTLERPSSACELKLLSLGGRGSVRLARLAVGLRPLAPGPELPPGMGIDLQQVQSLVQELGSGLSPGAQGLMDMVQAQQKNQSGSLGGFLPLLMGGGAFSALARGVGVAPGAPRDQPPSADLTVPE
ncbi:LOW QUALITY PROTEIN: ATPase PAAT, partial [Menidia menidia]